MKKSAVVLLLVLVIAACQQQQPQPVELPEEKPQIANPASVFCREKGFENAIVTAPDGSQAGYCRVKVNESVIECDEWKFLRGECPTCGEYCSKMPPATCAGEWNISGGYPACRCDFVCEKKVEPVITPPTVTTRDDVLDTFKQCLMMILPSMEEDIDLSELKVESGAKTPSMFECMGVAQQLQESPRFTGQSYQGKFIDAHNHFLYGSSVQELIGKMDAAKIDQMVILSGDSLPLHKKFPARIIPFGGDYTLTVERLSEVIENKIKEGYKGIGEISLRHAYVVGVDVETKNRADSDAMKKIADIAAKYDVPVVVHHESEFVELERLLDYNKNAKIILAHAGRMNLETPFRMDRLLKAHPNLYVDLSQQIPLFKDKIAEDDVEYLLLSTGTINPLWKHVIEKYPDRFMIGGDYYVENRDSLTRESADYRKFLGQLAPATAEKVAYKNILGLIPK